MNPMAAQIISLIIVYSSVHSGADQRNHQSSASLAFVWGVQRWPVNSPHKSPVTRQCFHLMTSWFLYINIGRNTGCYKRNQPTTHRDIPSNELSDTHNKNYKRLYDKTLSFTTSMVIFWKTNCWISANQRCCASILVWFLQRVHTIFTSISSLKRPQGMQNLWS